MNELKLSFLGSPRIELDGHPVEVRLQKALALMAYLAINRQSHRRDALATFLWPDYNQGQARSYLRNALWVLKESLGEAWFEVQREEVSLQSEASIWVDVDAFQQRLRAVEIHRILHPTKDLCQICANNLTEAADLYVGDFLTGFTLPDSPVFDDWQDYQTENLRQRLIETLERLARWNADQGNDSDSIPFARRLVLLDPLDEKAHRLLMEAYHRNGQVSAALHQYQEYSQILKKELGLSPSPEMTELCQSMKARQNGEVSHTHPQSAKREENFQPNPSEVLSGNPADVHIGIPVLVIPPLNLPGEAPFVKREGVLSKLETYLSEAISGHGRVVFISGQLGSGKTALGMEFARKAQKIRSDLIVSGGTCLPDAGCHDPYIVFREVLDLLAGEVEKRWASGLLTADTGSRIYDLLPAILQVLINRFPDLVASFLPSLNISSKLWAFDERNPDTASLRVKLFMMDFRVERTSQFDQAKLIDQYLDLLQTLSSQRPILLILDDFHWADPSSVRLLARLQHRICNDRILILVSFDPQQTNELPTQKLLENDPLSEICFIALDKITRQEGREYIDAWLALEPNRLDENFRQKSYEVTGGQPLFLSEYIQDMKERGELHRDATNYWIEAEHAFKEQPPVNLEEVIIRRINRLPKETRRVLEVASVQGLEFCAEVTADVLKMDWAGLVQLFANEQINNKLVEPLSLYQSGPQHLSFFRFHHCLIQEILYNQLDGLDRAHLHGFIGDNLEQVYGDWVDETAPQLAWHFQESGNPARAVPYFIKAGNLAQRLGSNQEASWLFQQGLTLVQTLPDSPEKGQQKHELLSSLKSTFQAR